MKTPHSKRILHLGKFFPPDRGGIESATASAVTAALRSGYEVTVLCFSQAAKSQPECLEHWPTQVGVATLHRMSAITISSQPLSWLYVRRGLQLAHDAEIVHLHFPNILAAMMAAHLPSRVRLVVHWHSDVVGKGWLGRLVAPWVHRMLRRADAVICTSANYAAASPVLAPYADRIHTVPLGVPDPSQSSASCRLPVAIQRWLRGRQMVLSVGRLVPYKGFDVLINAAAHLPGDAAVVIVGDGPCRVPLQQLIESLGLSSKVMLAGHVDAEGLAALFSHATVFALASNLKSEAFGVVLVEALAHALPVVACNIEGSGVPWVNQHETTGFNVPVNDPLALGQACQRLLSETELRVRLSSNARARYETTFSQSITDAQLMAVYASVEQLKSGA